MFSGYKKINQTFWTIVLFLLFPVVSFAQTRSIEGHVYDNETKQPIPLATVIIKNTNFGVYTAKYMGIYQPLTKQAKNITEPIVLIIKSRHATGLAPNSSSIFNKLAR